MLQIECNGVIMLFWFICGLLTLLAAAIIVIPLLRSADPVVENTDITIYKGQLAEIERDVAREVIAAEEAEATRIEIARRLIAADKAKTAQIASAAPSRWMAAVVLCILLGIAFATYWSIGAPGYPDMPLAERLATSERMRANRPDQAALEAAAPSPPKIDVPGDYAEAIAELREIAPTRPEDQQAWELLAFHESRLGNFSAAKEAAQRVIAIKGDAATLADQSLLLDLMVAAANGFVSPESETLANQILTKSPGNIPALYHVGALYDQTDRPDIAFELWRRIVEGGDPNNFHVATARAQIVSAAERAGLTYALPETRGPTFDQMDAAADMTAEDRQAMIGAMVDGLAARLETDGGPAEDWARLIRSYGVLGDMSAAQETFDKAQQTFLGSMRGTEILLNAARDVGLIE